MCNRGVIKGYGDKQIVQQLNAKCMMGGQCLGEVGRGLKKGYDGVYCKQTRVYRTWWKM